MTRSERSMPTFLIAASLALAGPAVLAAPPALAACCENPETTTFTAGVRDGFQLPTEPASPSAELLATLGPTPPRSFDQGGINLKFGHTFTGLPSGICGAKLTISVKAEGSATNDGLALELQNGGTFAWSQFVQTLAGPPWTSGATAVLSLDLKNLPPALNAGPTDLLSLLADGDLDLRVQDDTSVDFAQLEVQHCPPVPCVPPPSGLTAWFPLDESAGTVAHEIANHADGNYVDGPVPVVPGMFGNALSFDGIASHVSVPDDPALDFGVDQDFSVDFWIKTSQATGIRSLLEKRQLAPQEKGWTVFLVDGVLYLQLAEGGSGFCDSSTPSGCTNYSSGFFLADDLWHFVTITVERANPGGIKWYVGGGPVGTPGNPTFREDSLENSAPLLIGAHAFFPAYFEGALDEIEIFQRVLAPAEIQALYNSPGGKCKARLEQQWDISICDNQTTGKAQPLLCNDSSELKSFGLTFQGLPAGSYPEGFCSDPGPTQFTLVEAQPVLVPPGSCTTLNLTIQRPPGLIAGDTSCFEIHAEDLASGQVTTKKTSLWNTGAICCFPTGGTSTGVPVDSQVEVAFELLNLGATPRTVNFELESMSSDPATPLVVLNGQPAGDSVTGQVSVPARGRAQVAVDAALIEFRPFEQQDLLLVDRDSGAVLSSSVLKSFAPGCTADATNLCLNGGRFRVNVAWRDFAGRTGLGQAVTLTGDTGYFWFFNPANVELVLKVLDGRALNGYWWVFYGALSSVEYTITVTDTMTGASKSFSNPANALASVADTQAVPEIDLQPASASSPSGATASLATAVLQEAPAGHLAGLLSGAKATAGTCTAGDTVLCLREGRFQVEVNWQTPNGDTGDGNAIALTSDTGYFWFFRDTNVELVLKILDGTVINDHWWVFYGALSNVRYTIRITDTVTGATKTYVNPQGNLASVADVVALPE